MAGYYIYTLDGGVFAQLTTEPSLEDGLAFAQEIYQDIAECFDGYADDEEMLIWPTDPITLARSIIERFRMLDWYGDLSFANAMAFDEIVDLIRLAPGEKLGIDLRYYTEDESIYWDCADLASANGVKMMDNQTFGVSGFRYNGPLRNANGPCRQYSIYTSDQCQNLLTQLRSVERAFDASTDGTVREQFFEGLLPPVEDAAKNGRVPWVNTDY